MANSLTRSSRPAWPKSVRLRLLHSVSQAGHFRESDAAIVVSDSSCDLLYAQDASSQDPKFELTEERSVPQRLETVEFLATRRNLRRNLRRNHRTDLCNEVSFEGLAGEL